MSYYFEIECPRHSDEFETLIGDMLTAVIPWEGPVEQDGNQQARCVGGSIPGRATVSVDSDGPLNWAWRPTKGGDDTVYRRSGGTYADGWAQVELAIRRQMVRR